MTQTAFDSSPPDVIPSQSDRILAWGGDLAVLVKNTGEIGAFSTRHPDLGPEEIERIVRPWMVRLTC